MISLKNSLLYSSASGIWTTNLWHVRPVLYPFSYSDMLIICVVCKTPFQKNQKDLIFTTSICHIQSLIKLQCVYQSFVILFEICWLVWKILFNQYSLASGIWTTNLWHVRPVPYHLSYSDILILMCCTAKRHSFKIKAESVDFFIAIYVY